MSSEATDLPDRLHTAWDQLSSIRTVLTLYPETVTVDRLRVMLSRMLDVEGTLLAAETELRTADIVAKN